MVNKYARISFYGSAFARFPLTIDDEFVLYFCAPRNVDGGLEPSRIFYHMDGLGPLLKQE